MSDDHPLRTQAPLPRTRAKTQAERDRSGLHGPRLGPDSDSPGGRHCTACGRTLDGEGHELAGWRPMQDRRGRIRKVREYRCRVRLVARMTAPVLGGKGDERKVVSTYVPDSPQRTRKNLTAFVPLAILHAQEQANA